MMEVAVTPGATTRANHRNYIKFHITNNKLLKLPKNILEAPYRN